MPPPVAKVRELPPRTRKRVCGGAPQDDGKIVTGTVTDPSPGVTVNGLEISKKVPCEGHAGPMPRTPNTTTGPFVTPVQRKVTDVKFRGRESGRGGDVG